MWKESEEKNLLILLLVPHAMKKSLWYYDISSTGKFRSKNFPFFFFFFKGFFFFIKKYPTAKITFVFTVKSCRQNYWNANGIDDDNDVAIRKNNESTVHDDHESQKRKHYEHT